MAIALTGMKALCMCSMGTGPAPLKVLPDKMVMCEGGPMPNIMDNKPLVNVGPFAMCISLANPTVAAATAAALGVLTPMPCIPNTVVPWTPGNTTVMVKNIPAINNSCTLMCNWGGAITITNPGTAKTMV